MIQLTNKYLTDESAAFIISDKKQIKDIQLSKVEMNFAEKMLDNKANFVHINSFYKSLFILLVNSEKDEFTQLEDIRKSGNRIITEIKELKLETINIVNLGSENFTYALCEGIMLSKYGFHKYFKDKAEKTSSLKEIKVVSSSTDSTKVDLLNALIEGVYNARDIVNEPLSFMTAQKLSQEIERIGKETGFKTEILDKKQIESLKMGGLIAVNRGSIHPPTFSIMRWEPENAINEKPYVFVGKGLVFDTGGINLKPSGYLETMKCDKAGGATVVGLMAAIAKAKLPIKVIGLVPATDNRPGNDAYVPEDIITMFDGTTVEVLNTDAEGRMILADALAYAKKYKPQLVIDLATLTGAAVVAVGENTTAVMGNTPKEIEKLKTIGFEVWEKLVELPLWDEYKEQLKSSVADLKNIGGKYAGAITAGKFLEHFTDYDWIHLDIAGPAFTEKDDSYRGIGGTGVGVRLLFEFLKQKAN
ncbi:MAG: leucyl aminopeptidase [Bacteroidales bacterium]|nr:leucyl aminopeptidase [Bacteroidales bacterium]MDD4216683.1 leucyl aminopeptidase [Bacteroidales bacterium]